MVAHENPFDERVINFRLRIDRRARSVALRAIDPTRGGGKFTPPGRQTRLIQLKPYARCAESTKNLYELHNNMARALNMLYQASKRTTFKGH